MAELIVNREDVDIQTEQSFKELIISYVKNRNSETINIRVYCISKEVAEQLLTETAEENPEYYWWDVESTLVAINGAYYKETGLKHATALKLVYSSIRRNIYRGNRIPNQIQRVVNGEMKKTVAVYRIVNGSVIKFWEE